MKRDISLKLYLVLDSQELLLDTNPIFKDVKVETEKEKKEEYWRDKITGSVYFVKKDFELIYSVPIDTQFLIKIYDSSDTLLATSSFNKKDCDFDVDNKQVKVSLDAKDRYTKILAGLENEYNLVELAPVRETVHMYKRAILQLYMLGDTKVTNVIGNMSYEVDANETDSDTDVRNDGFSLIKMHRVVELTATTAAGQYQGTVAESGTSTLWRSDGEYYLVLTWSSTYWAIRVYDKDGNVYTGSDVVTGATQYYGMLYPTSVQITMQMYAPSLGTISYGYANATINDIYGRVLIASSSVTSPISNIYILDDDDICTRNLNYNYAMKATGEDDISGIVQLTNWIRVSLETQADPTQWGVNASGEYFVAPSPASSGDNVLPVAWNRWSPASFWLNSSVGLNTIMDQWKQQWNFQDAYPLWSVIDVLLKQIDPSVTFAGNSTYSQFIYGSISSSYLYLWVKQLLYITPITNIKRTYYDQAARKGTITLGQVLDMLKAFKCYWWIDSSNRLRIEHITYFKRGGTYSTASRVISSDLTSLGSPLPGKAWAFGQNSLSYEDDLPARYEFSWAEDCSECFNGFALDIQNDFVEGGSTESLTVGNFIPDLDLIMSAPDSLSDDLFALIGTNTSKYVPITQTGTGHSTLPSAPTYVVQNGRLSFYWLELAYWGYDLSGDKAYSEKYGGYLYSWDTFWGAKQSVQFPCTLSKAVSLGLVRTGIGDGEKIKSVWDTSSKSAKIDLRLPTATGVEDRTNQLTVQSSATVIVITNNSTEKLNVVMELYLSGPGGNPHSYLDQLEIEAGQTGYLQARYATLTEILFAYPVD